MTRAPDTIETRLARGDRRFSHIEKQLGAIAEQTAEATETVATLVATVERLSAKVDQMTEAFEAYQTAKNMGKFAKWLGGVLAGLTAAYIAARAGVLHFVGK